MLELTRLPAHAQLLELLRQRIGLDPSSVGTECIPAALAALGVHEPVAFTELVDAMQRDPALLEPLVQRIVVHETWFFRDPAAFEVLVETAVRLTASGRRVRVLSVPCSTGEEAVSIAMALAEAGIDEQQAEVIGIDISAQAIAQARRGVFGELAFRTRPPAWRDAHFEPEGRGWRLRRMPANLRFEVGNLLDLPVALATERYDAVFCRNLLIYLDPPARERVAASLRALAHAPDGLLFVGPSESADAFGGRLERVTTPMSFAFRNRAIVRPPVRPPLRTSAPPAPIAAAWRDRRVVPPTRPTPTPPTASPKTDALDPHDALAQVGRLADRGETTAAIAACDALLARRPDATDAHALRGALAVASGETELALVHLGRALYLDPRHRQALHDMALLAQSRGDHGAGQRYLDRLRRLPADKGLA